jgi:hypothetical protein
MLSNANTSPNVLTLPDPDTWELALKVRAEALELGLTVDDFRALQQRLYPGIAVGFLSRPQLYRVLRECLRWRLKRDLEEICTDLLRP